MNGSTDYHFTLIPYNWNTSNAPTYNYRTSISIPASNCTTPAAPSTSSDIIDAADISVYTSNIDYTQWQSAAITGTGTGTNGSIGVFKFILRDGGTGMNDSDVLPTILTGISFSYSGTSGTVRSAALFDGNTLIAQSAPVTANSFSFAGLSGAAVTANDNSSKTMTLRVTFNTAVTDNDKLIFTVSSATAGSSSVSSQFTAANAGGAFSDNNAGNDRNRIEVTASKLVFSQQPVTTSVNMAMSPAPAVSALDANNNTDLDFTGSVSVTSTGTMTGNPIMASAASGTAQFTSVVHTVAGTGYTMTATSSGLTGITSTTFDITSIVYVNGDYRTTGTGNWISNNASPAIWERYSAGLWNTSNSPSFNTSNNVYIREGNTLTTNGNYGTGVKFKVMDGGTLNLNHTGTVASMYVYAGGSLNISANFIVTAGGEFSVEDNASVTVSYSFTNPSTSIWQGEENFRPASQLNIWGWNDGMPLIDGNVTPRAYNGYTAAFGNVSIDLSGTAMGGVWNMLGANTGMVNLTHGNFVFDSPGGFDVRFLSTAGSTANVGIQGHLKMNSRWPAARSVILGTSNANLTITVKGNVEIDSPGDFALRASNSSLGGVTLNIEGNLLINGPNTTANTNFKMNQNSYGTAAGSLSVVNLKGNLLVGANPTIINTAPSADVQFNFTGTALQQVNVASVIGAGSSTGVPFYIKNGAYARLESNNLTITNGSSVTVEDGGKLHFNWDGSNNPLLVMQPTVSPAGTNTFTSAQGSTLYVTSPQGLVKNTVNSGNVQLPVANKTFNQTATFWYIGKTNQVTGDGLTNTSTAKIVYANLTDNNITLTLTNNIGISNATTLDALGGRLEIQRGIVIGTTGFDFYGTGRLVMSDGEYRISTITASPLSDYLPQLSGYSTYSLTAGLVHLNGSNANQILAAIPVYYKLAFSGTNTLGTDYKGISGATVVTNNVNIFGAPVVDTENKSLNGNAGLNMSGGRLRMAKISATLPELLGISTPYSLSGGIIELYGTTASESHLIRGTYNGSTTVTYYNVELNAQSANTEIYNINAADAFAVAGTLNTNSPAVFQLDETDIIIGTGNFNVNAGATLKYAHADGITSSGTTGNVRTNNRTFPATASYGFTGPSNQVSGTGLPASMVNMYVDKQTASAITTLTNTARVDNTLRMIRGNVNTAANLLELGVSTAQTGTLNHSTGFVLGRMRRWFTGMNSGNASGLFPMGYNESGLKNRNTRIEYTAPAAAGGHLTVEFIASPMGNAGLMIPAASSAGANFDVLTTEDQGYWKIDNQPGTLTDGAYTIACTGEGFANINSEMTLLKRVLSSSINWFCTGTYLTTTGYPSMPVVSRGDMSGWSNFGFGSGAGSPLPVELISFSAECTGNSVQTRWATASEQHTSHFVVERSADLTNWSKAGEVTAAGNSSQVINYELTDNVFLRGLSYYRLIQVDLNGNSKIYDPLSLNCTQEEENHLTVYPNPSQGIFTVEWSNPDLTGKVEITLTSSTGTMISSRTAGVSNGKNIFPFQEKLAPGLYYVTLKHSATREETVKLVIR